MSYGLYKGTSASHRNYDANVSNPVHSSDPCNQFRNFKIACEFYRGGLLTGPGLYALKTLFYGLGFLSKSDRWFIYN